MSTVSHHPYDQDDEFPEHDGQGPDVDPATGDERETTGPDGEPL